VAGRHHAALSPRAMRCWEGAVQRKKRVQQEIALLRREGYRVAWDDDEGSWVVIWDFQLPAGLGRPTTHLLLRVPDDYPTVPPYGIHVDPGLQLPAHYFQYKGMHYPQREKEAGEKGWAWYCFKAFGHRGGWSPSARAAEADNLLRYLRLTRLLMEASVRHG
jgi:hypothetical protein